MLKGQRKFFTLISDGAVALRLFVKLIGTYPISLTKKGTQLLSTPEVSTVPILKILVFSPIRTELSSQINVLLTVLRVITISLPMSTQKILHKK